MASFFFVAGVTAAVDAEVYDAAFLSRLRADSDGGERLVAARVAILWSPPGGSRKLENNDLGFFFYIGLHFFVTVLDQLGSCRQVRFFEAFSGCEQSPSLAHQKHRHFRSLRLSGTKTPSPPFPAVASMQISPSSIYSSKM